MCLAVPGKIMSVDASVPGLKMAKVDFGGIIKSICIEWVDASEGEYILAHAGMAISKIDNEYAEQTLEDFDAIARAIEEE